MNYCKVAYVKKSIFEEKTIEAETFLDNLVKEFNKNHK